MPDFEKYYEEEMRFLLESGREFAEAFPEKARHLNLAAVEDRDPYVERLFEGFAFLSARIRQKLEDDFPEFTRNLMEMVAPEFLHGIPSLAMLEFGFRQGMLRRPHIVPRGTIVLSNPVGPELQVCRFQTTRDTQVLPIKLQRAEATHHSIHGDGIALDLEVDKGAEIDALTDFELPIHLHGEKALAWMLHLYLTEKVSRLACEVGGVEFHLGGQEKVVPGGFGDGESLLPGLDNAFAGGRPLQEFFAFDEKFRSVRVLGLDFSKLPLQDGSVRLCFYLRQGLPGGKRFRDENFRLNAVPIVNLFHAQAEPVNLNHKHFEYPLMADGGRSDDVFDVVDVVGVDKNTGRRRHYHKFHEFRQHVVVTGDSQSEAYYQVRQESTRSGRLRTYLSVGSHGKVEELGEEYLSISVLATNGALPRETLFENAICNPSPGFPGSLTFTNFTRPTSPLPPPKAPHFLWHVLAQMNMNLRTLCRADQFREVLSLYDWPHSAANRKVVEGVMETSAERKAYLFGSQVIRGTEVLLQIKDGTLSDEGELQVFARVVLAFLSQYTTINHLVGLRLVSMPSGRTMQLEPLEGRCHSI